MKVIVNPLPIIVSFTHALGPLIIVFMHEEKQLQATSLILLTVSKNFLLVDWLRSFKNGAVSHILAAFAASLTIVCKAKENIKTSWLIITTGSGELVQKPVYYALSGCYKAH